MNEFLDPDGLDDHLDDPIASDPAALEDSASFHEAPEQIQRGIWSRLKHASHATVLGAVALFGGADDAYAERNVAGAKQESRENIETVEAQPFGIAEDDIVVSIHLKNENGKARIRHIERRQTVPKGIKAGLYYEISTKKYLQVTEGPRGTRIFKEIKMLPAFLPQEGEQFEKVYHKELGLNVFYPPLKYENHVEKDPTSIEVPADAVYMPGHSFGTKAMYKRGIKELPAAIIETDGAGRPSRVRAAGDNAFYDVQKVKVFNEKSHRAFGVFFEEKTGKYIFVTYPENKISERMYVQLNFEQPAASEVAVNQTSDEPVKPQMNVENLDDESLVSINTELRKAGYLIDGDDDEDDDDDADVEIKPRGPEELPSIQQPSGFKVMPFNAFMVVKGRKGGQVLMPCPPEAFLDQNGLGNLVTVTDQKGKKFPAKVEIVHGKTPEKNGGLTNSFIRVDLGDSDSSQTLTIDMIGWVSLGEYEAMPRQAISAKMDPKDALQVGNAMQAAAAIQWRPIVADCGVKACRAREVAGVDEDGRNLVEVMEGITTDPKDEAAGSIHALNVVFDKNAGAFTFDPRTPQNLYVGPQKNMIITGFGQPYLDIEGWPDKEEPYANGGRTHGVTTIQGLKVSLPGIGLRGEQMRELQQNIPDLIARRAKKLQEKRMKEYEALKVALGQK